MTTEPEMNNLINGYPSEEPTTSSAAQQEVPKLELRKPSVTKKQSKKGNNRRKRRAKQIPEGFRTLFLKIIKFIFKHITQFQLLPKFRASHRRLQLRRNKIMSKKRFIGPMSRRMWNVS